MSKTISILGYTIVKSSIAAIYINHANPNRGQSHLLEIYIPGKRIQIPLSGIEATKEKARIIEELDW